MREVTPQMAVGLATTDGGFDGGAPSQLGSDLGPQNVQPIADAPSPVAHAGALVGQCVLEELLAGEVLEIGVPHPALPGPSDGLYQWLKRLTHK